jgi:hypothetical protein
MIILNYGWMDGEEKEWEGLTVGEREMESETQSSW